MNRRTPLDPASATVIARFVVGMTAIATWYVFSRAVGGRLSLATMYVLTAVFVAMVAARRGESFVRSSLTRWDEALAFLGLSALAGAADR